MALVTLNLSLPDLHQASLLGEVQGACFYRMAVVAIVRDGTVDELRLEADWQTSVEAELLATRLELAKARQELANVRQLPAPATNGVYPDPLITEVAPAAQMTATSKRFGDETIAPSREYNLPVRPPTTPTPERYQCPACDKLFDSAERLASHTCRSRELLAADASDDPPVPVIPSDPAEAAALLAKLTAKHWPHPCPDCWAAGIVAMYQGPQGLGVHRAKSHGIKANKDPGAPLSVPSPDGWRCTRCHSGTFAPSVADKDVCVKCVRKGA